MSESEEYPGDGMMPSSLDVKFVPFQKVLGATTDMSQPS
jgi:hypothetical protein